MTKLYTKSGLVGGEKRSTKILLHEWIAAVCNDDPFTKIFYDYLQQHGKYFKEIHRQYPAGLIRPEKVELKECHKNNCVYIEELLEKQPASLIDIRFVSGLFGMQAIRPGVPVGEEYFIGHHSFITYKGFVVDCTMLEYPPGYYALDQYFGIEFEIPKVIEAYRMLYDEGVDVSKRLPLEHLRIALTER